MKHNITFKFKFKFKKLKVLFIYNDSFILINIKNMFAFESVSLTINEHFFILINIYKKKYIYINFFSNQVLHVTAQNIKI